MTLAAARDAMLEGMQAFAASIEEKRKLYALLTERAMADDQPGKFFRIEDRELLARVLANFAVSLTGAGARHDLSTIYEARLHKQTGALVIANKGATLLCLSPRTDNPYIARHIGFCIYFPGLGIEIVNVGLVGNVYDGNVILRSESACTPSFLFGSQRCNCAHQWETMGELAAHFNSVQVPDIADGRQFEKWVQGQFVYKGGKHLPTTPGPGMITMHVDTQNGMGSGYTASEFSFDLFSRASLRHRGEYSAEQIHQTTMAGGFEAIGIQPDPRSASDECGYKITPVVLDWLDVSEDLVFLSNNTAKIRQLELAGYRVDRIKSLGKVNPAGAQEAEERGTEFHHLDIDETQVTFEDEMQRLTSEIAGRLAISKGSAGQRNRELAVSIVQDFTPVNVSGGL